jgi:hypothetical protein
MSNVLTNYKRYMDQNPLIFESPEASRSLITEDIEYKAFTEALLEGIENKDEVRDILNREREMLLEEAESFLSSPESIAYAVSAYPMLVYTYSTPVLSEGCTLYTTSKPVFSVPRLKWVAKIIDEAGGVTEVDFPTVQTEVRPGVKILAFDQQYDNLFTLTSTNKDEFRISKRGLAITSISYDDSGTAVPQNFYIPVNARGDFGQEVDILDGGGAVVDTYKITGTVDTVTGNVNWSAIQITTANAAATFTQFTVKFRLFGIGNNKSVVKVYPKNDILDINCGEDSSFEIENIAEVIQDWKALYNVDVFAQLNDMVRLQLDLNRDWDIAELLQAGMADMATAGLYRLLDMNGIPSINFQDYQSILRTVVPKIMAIRERIFKLTRREANVIFCGTDAAAWLKSIQDAAISFDGSKGNVALSGSVGEFAKMKIISSNAIPDNLVFILIKGTTPSEAVILISAYKPLYTIKETTDSRTRMFIKSRVSVDLVRTDSVGYIELINYDEYL